MTLNDLAIVIVHEANGLVYAQ